MQKVRSPGTWKGTACLLGLLLLVVAAPGLLAQEPDPVYEILDPGTITKYATELVKPPAFPKAAKVPLPYCLLPVDYYEIGVRQFEQQILPDVGRVQPDHRVELRPGRRAAQPGLGEPVQLPRLHHRGEVAAAGGGQVGQPAGRRERQLPAPPAAGRPDPALGQPAGAPGHGRHEPGARTPGPVPIVTHVHGAHTFDWSDGLHGGLVPAESQRPALRSSTRPAPSTTTSTGSTSWAGSPARRPTPTPTTSGPAPSGTTTTPWA